MNYEYCLINEIFNFLNFREKKKKNNNIEVSKILNFGNLKIDLISEVRNKVSGDRQSKKS